MGFDINFNKHTNHGIEFRILDFFPEEQLHDFMCTLVHLMDHSLIAPAIPNPVEEPKWNDLMLLVICKGAEARFDDEIKRAYQSVFPFSFRKVTGKDMLTIFEYIQRKLKKMYHNMGECSINMIRTRQKESFCALM